MPPNGLGVAGWARQPSAHDQEPIRRVGVSMPAELSLGGNLVEDDDIISCPLNDLRDIETADRIAHLTGARPTMPEHAYDPPPSLTFGLATVGFFV